mgnify:FL=1
MKKIMKKILIVVCLLLIASSAFAAWSGKINSSRVEDDTLTLNVTYTNGVVSETVDVAIFQPTTKAYVIQSLKNRGLTIKRKYLAMAAISSIKPSVDAEIGNSTPVES